MADNHTERFKKQSEVNYWLTPMGSGDAKGGTDTVRKLLGQKRYGLGRHSLNRNKIKPNDWMCFYVAKVGVVAHARITTYPEYRPDLDPFFPMVFNLDDTHIYVDRPTPLDSKMRESLDFFNRTARERWGFYLITTRKISRRDFDLLTKH